MWSALKPRAKAILVGESLMREADIAAKVRDLGRAGMSEPLRVLVIEDSALDAKVLGLLSAGGYEVASDRVGSGRVFGGIGCSGMGCGIGGL